MSISTVFQVPLFFSFLTPTLNPLKKKKKKEKKNDLEGRDRKRIKSFLHGGTYNINSKLIRFNRHI